MSRQSFAPARGRGKRRLNSQSKLACIRVRLSEMRLHRRCQVCAMATVDPALFPKQELLQVSASSRLNGNL